MNSILNLFAVSLVALLFSAGCRPPGKPTEADIELKPGEVRDFALLYKQNCAGCHGKNGDRGAALPISNPVYLAIVDPEALRKIIAQGVRGTPMPAFAQSAGGMLTEKQIDAIASGIRSQWSQPNLLAGIQAPRYSSGSDGDAEQGAADYKIFCESCHGANGRGGPRGSSIFDPAFLSLKSDQGLRTIIIVGRPDLGAPDWRSNVPGRAMSDKEITDTEAWLSRQRPENIAHLNSRDREFPNVR